MGLSRTRGERIYSIHCVTCHQADGKGVAGVMPPVSQTEWVNGSKTRLINVMLHGLAEKIEVNGIIYDEIMPKCSHLDDEAIADVLTYIRSSFGNNSGAVREKEVRSIREGNTIDDEKSTDDSEHNGTMKIESKVGNHFQKGELLMDQIFLPENFKIKIFVDNLENPRSLAIGPKGTVFVDTRRNKSEFIYAIQDFDQNGKADTIIKIDQGLKWNPMGVAMLGADLFVGEIDRILKYENIEDLLYNPNPPKEIFKYPPVKKHGEKYIRFGPDCYLYIPVGAPCNNCLDENPIFSTITRIKPDGSAFEIYACGVRNSRGFDWHPVTGELWFTDNGRDHLGEDEPPCEVKIAKEKGGHYGFPYCHGINTTDPEFGNLKGCRDFIPAAFGLVAHAAPVSMMFYTGNMFPHKYKNQILVSEHGSWNRTEKQGYRVMLLEIQDQKVVSYTPFIYGWLDISKNDAWGRPVDLLQMPDGSILLSDDHAGVIYRIFYEP